MNRAPLATLLIFAAACGHGDARLPDPASSPAAPDARAAEEAADRAELVLPPPYFWRPTVPQAALKLTLTLEKTNLKSGEKPRYLLEMQNIGGKDVSIYEDPSFVKFGVSHLIYHPYWTRPGAPEEKLIGPVSFGRQMMTVDEIRKRGPTKLELTLHSGETLVTRPDSPAPNRFREIKTLMSFDKPGNYRLRFVYDPAGEPASKVESNSVDFVVAQ